MPITGPMMYAPHGTHGRVGFSADGRRLLVATGGDRAWLRDLSPATGTLDELRLQADVLSCQRIDPVEGVVPLGASALSNSWQRLCSARPGL